MSYAVAKNGQWWTLSDRPNHVIAWFGGEADARKAKDLFDRDSGYTQISDKLDLILKQQGDFMASVAQDINALIDAMKTYTDTVAARIDKLTAGIKNSMTDDEVAAIKAGLAAERDRLQAMGQDPANPIPNP